MIELTGSRSQIVDQPLPVDDPVQRCPDIARARDMLDWEPSVPLDTGAARTIAYFDNLLSGAVTAARRASLRLEPRRGIADLAVAE